ncbi:MAG: thiol-disulfide oxidoreductase DCC family protein [Limisphaerales bacterium]
MAENTLIYDSDCPLCKFQMKLLTWLDWFNCVRLLPIKDPEAAQVAPKLTREALLEAIHVVTPENKIHRGARCIRYLGLRMPLLIPLALFLWIPGIIWIAEIVYQWISRNRHLLSKWFGCGEACSIMPARERKEDTLVD